VPAGDYHVICDAIILAPVDVTFTLIWRRGAADMTVAQWNKHFEPPPGGGYNAQPYELDVAGTAIDFQAGDQLVFRYEGISPLSTQGFIPNGDGPSTHGRLPNITIPH